MESVLFGQSSGFILSVHHIYITHFTFKTLCLRHKLMYIDIFMEYFNENEKLSGIFGCFSNRICKPAGLNEANIVKLAFLPPSSYHCI